MSGSSLSWPAPLARFPMQTPVWLAAPARRAGARLCAWSHLQRRTAVRSSEDGLVGPLLIAPVRPLPACAAASTPPESRGRSADRRHGAAGYDEAAWVPTAG